MRKFLPALVVLALFSGCGFREKQIAEGVAERYFAAAAAGDASAVGALYHPGFYRTFSRERWGELTASLQERRGKPVAHRLVSWEARRLSSSSGRVRHVTLIYEVDYERGEGREEIGLLVAAGSFPGIRSHRFISRNGEGARRQRPDLVSLLGSTRTSPHPGVPDDRQAYHQAAPPRLSAHVPDMGEAAVPALAGSPGFHTSSRPFPAADRHS